MSNSRNVTPDNVSAPRREGAAAGLRNPNHRRSAGRPRTHAVHGSPGGKSGRNEIIRYFEERRSRREVVTTTRTPSGQILDWVLIESQCPDGRIASPPPSGPGLVPGTEPGTKLSGFELDHPDAERGPSGTVPVLHRDFSQLTADRSLADYLSKHGRADIRLIMMPNGTVFADPEIGGHAYAQTQQTVDCWGGEGNLSTWDPYTQSSNDFSLMQIALYNNESGTLQTAEGGWQVYHDKYGDWAPHLFVFYTTDNYKEGSGGYNQEVDGWVQYDSGVYPGATVGPTSTPGGTQYILPIKYQLWQGNWWFRSGGRWIGYYPTSLWEGNQSVFENLGDHASAIQFYGEVADSEGGSTISDMGSGYWAKDGWTWAAYQSNLLVQTDRGGGLSGYNGAGWASDPGMYSVVTQMNSGTNWGSYFWLGGPGAG
jgi:hypothetical protein